MEQSKFQMPSKDFQILLQNTNKDGTPNIKKSILKIKIQTN